VRRFVRSSDAWIAYGRRAAAELHRLGADADRIVISPNVSRPPAPLDPAVPSGREPHGVRFLFVGQLIERKGVRELLDAFALVEGGELAFAGDGELSSLVVARAATDRRIRVLGHLDADELDELYARSDVLVLPSLYEVWGLVVNEALERGRPVIVSDQVGAAADLVAGQETGLVVRAGSRDSLAAAMRAVLTWSDREWQLRSQAARAMMGRWTREQAADALVEAARLGVEHRRSRL
jgi:glycosyltransferase involved in cell wall biosynthesis